MTPIVIGIAGGSGSGKTTLARAISRRIGSSRVVVIQHDAYYRDLSHLAPRERSRVNFDHPGAIESSLCALHLAALKRGEPVTRPVYDFVTHTRSTDTVPLEPRPVIILEGILVLAERALREAMDLRVFLDVDAETCLRRRIGRDAVHRGRSAASVRRQYAATVLPMHRRFVEPCAAYADVVVAGGGENREAAAAIAAWARGRIGSHG